MDGSKMRTLKFNFVLTLVLFFAVTVQAAVWVSGSKLILQPGVYGTKGEPNSSNVPGARYDSISWTDTNDNLLLFGGNGRAEISTGRLNDLWSFDGTNWTWVSGTKLADQNGVYGTKGEPNSSNVPGGRYQSISWTSNKGDLWLFGGYGYDESSEGYLNDFWRYEPNNGMWTWVSGSKLADQYGVYGTKGEPNSSNVPGARGGSISWTDSEGDLCLFGGYGYDESSEGCLNDLWRYDSNNGMWTWVSGSKLADQYGVYGTKGEPNSSNVPRGRYQSISWTDSEGDLWLFGGLGYIESLQDYLNDLWRYDPNNGMWTWVSGSKLADQYGIYAAKGELIADTVPGSRRDSISWIDSNDNLWLFGGYGYDESEINRLNDLWKFKCVLTGDLNGDCIVNFLDFAIMVSHWLEQDRDKK